MRCPCEFELRVGGSADLQMGQSGLLENAADVGAWEIGGYAPVLSVKAGQAGTACPASLSQDGGVGEERQVGATAPSCHRSGGE
jgi:hypothetical protein